ncbi:hypothetical protein [Rhodococcus sp. T7]|uniref:hypothetical protein n=1 Tax=Rhodococcus sp. T7 TaxID=627444 RepID=UPI001359BFE1|nr:hypothetical protein [Rhodococcus sp. T7]KAF0959798.1 hypothetical protein MLGJGCBP_07134 [Rhodococcus sp. T7]
MLTTTEYAICDTCAVVLVNDDYSGIDSEDLANVEAFASAHLVTHTGEYDPAGYWTCEACESVQIGTGHIFEMEA